MMRVSGGGARITEGKTVKGKMEVAVAIGTDPSLMFAAIVPAPPEVEEYMIAGFLRQKPLELVKCETVDLEVPATSEIVLEGYVNLDELKVEGPSAITRASIRWRTSIRFSTCSASRTGRIRFTRPRSLASLRRKTRGWERPSEVSSSR